MASPDLPVDDVFQPGGRLRGEPQLCAVHTAGAVDGIEAKFDAALHLVARGQRILDRGHLAHDDLPEARRRRAVYRR